MTIQISPRALLVGALALGTTITLLLLGTGPAQGAPSVAAQAKARTFVSTKGLDTNTCGPADPCRTISRALVETSAGGEVVVLDSGGYGPFTVDKSVTVTAVGVYAGITATTGNAITITAGASDKVVLRGLTLNGLGGSRGIQATSLGQLYLDDLKVKNFTAEGIVVGPSVVGSVFVANTVVSGSGEVGLRLAATSGLLATSVSNSRFERNSTGVLAYAFGSRVMVRDSIAVDNTSNGFEADGGVLNLERAVSVGNTVSGLSACNYGSVRASETYVTGNGTGLSNCALSQTVSFGNNRVYGNGNTTNDDGTFTSMVAQK